MDPLLTINKFQTLQSEKTREDQIENNAGGYVFEVDTLQRALRFLILGTDGGTYYTSERSLTKDNANFIIELANSDEGIKLVDLLVDVSLKGRASRQNPTLFTLAVCVSSTNEKVKSHALENINSVCRTATMLFQFIAYVENLRGWGRALKKGVANWYLTKDINDLAYQIIKYRNRHGFTHRDVLRLSHPKTDDGNLANLFRWTVGKEYGEDLPEIIDSFIQVQTKDVRLKVVLKEINKGKLPWEAIPTELLNEHAVWDELLPHIGLTALIRNLSRLSSIGYIKPLKDISKITALFTDENIKRSRLHPLNVAVALRTYDSGRGFRGSLTWEVNTDIVDLLNKVLIKSFNNVESTNKRTLIALDVSGSMSNGNVCNSFLRPIDAEAILAMSMVKSEPKIHTMAFSGELVQFPIYKNSTMKEVLKQIDRMDFGGTDCSLPMIYAQKNNIEVDTFIIMTDNETWAGKIHPFEALKQYRKSSGINARLVVIGMTSTKFTIADPTDKGMLDVVGMDTSVPELIASFSKQEF